MPVFREFIIACLFSLLLAEEIHILSKRAVHCCGMTIVLSHFVTLLSTNARPPQSDTVERREGDGTCRSVPCPAAIALTNTSMGGVDRNDQLRGYYPM